MPRPAPSSARAAAGAAIPRIAFDRRKYGRHLLLDVGRVRRLEGFIIGAPHALTFFEIMLVTRGTGWLSLDAERHRVRAGQVLFTSPGQVRQWDTRGFDGICLFFEHSFINEFLQDAMFLSRLPYFHAGASQASLRLSPHVARGLRNRLATMQREIGHFRQDSVELLRATLHETLVTLAREFATAHGVSAQRPTHRVVAQFLELLERDVIRRHRVADYAAELAISPGHLSTLCSQFAGAGAKELVARALTSRACRALLYTDESIDRIGASLGFKDPSYFTRFFRRETGETPKEFRKGR